MCHEKVLGGGPFQIFLGIFTRRNWGKNIPILTIIIFSYGLVSTTNQSSIGIPQKWRFKTGSFDLTINSTWVGWLQQDQMQFQGIHFRKFYGRNTMPKARIILHHFSGLNSLPNFRGVLLNFIIQGLNIPKRHIIHHQWQKCMLVIWGWPVAMFCEHISDTTIAEASLLPLFPLSSAKQTKTQNPNGQL